MTRKSTGGNEKLVKEMLARVRHRAAKQGVALHRLCCDAGVNPNVWQKWNAGTTQPSIRVLERLLGVQLWKEMRARIERRAKRSGRTVHGLFRENGVNYNSWGQWNRGEALPTVRVLDRLLR